MIATVLDLLFGCRHRRLTRPITPVHKYGVPGSDTYVACLECGKQFHYDATKMRLGAPITAARALPANGVRAFQSQC